MIRSKKQCFFSLIEVTVNTHKTLEKITFFFVNERQYTLNVLHLKQCRKATGANQ